MQEMIEVSPMWHFRQRMHTGRLARLGKEAVDGSFAGAIPARGAAMVCRKTDAESESV